MLPADHSNAVFLLCLPLLLAASVLADPSYDNLGRSTDLEDEDTMAVDASERILDPDRSKQLKIQKQSAPAAYSDYEYYLGGRHSGGHPSGPYNDPSPTSSLKIHGESNLAALNRPVHKPLPWFDDYGSAKPLPSAPMYPSRSYDPYIRRYDRYDEQYHRTYPQYFEDMYMHRQRYDPYDSYSPRVPQYPDPYVMYPDRYLDTPAARDYVKARRGYLEESNSMSLPDAYGSSKYGSAKLPDMTLPAQRNERIVYYAHLPEIVRTPYDVSRPEERNLAALTMSAAPYKLNKKKVKNNLRPSANNATSYKMPL
ncbi:hypothetical protein KR009_003755 [Drosophila setifemur]|nr:hypothetical protein KR009_003755 [Drosophila setifemur]